MKEDLIKITIGEEGIKSINKTEMSESTLKRYYTKIPKISLDDIFVRKVNTADTVVMCRFDKEAVHNLITLLTDGLKTYEEATV
jgi:hypothetical protein